MENKQWADFSWSERDPVIKKGLVSSNSAHHNFGTEDLSSQTNFNNTSSIFGIPGTIGQNNDGLSKDLSMSTRIENNGSSHAQSQIINVRPDEPVISGNGDYLPFMLPFSPPHYNISWACGSPPDAFHYQNDLFMNQNGNMSNACSIAPRTPTIINASMYSTSPSNQISSYESPFMNRLTKDFGELTVGPQQSSTNILSAVPSNFNNYGNAITPCLPMGYQQTPPTGSLASSPNFFGKYLGGSHLFGAPGMPNSTMPGVSGSFQMYGGNNCLTTAQRPSPSNFGFLQSTQPRGDEESVIDPRASSILNEFRSNRNLQLSLAEITDNVIEFAQDQNGSRFIQQRLERANLRDKQAIFEKVHAHAHRLMVDVFGNYVIQKFFEFGTTEQKNMLMDALRGNVINLALQMYGCRVIQKALEFVRPEQQLEILEEMRDKVVQCVIDQNGNHVVQKAIEQVEAKHLQFVIDRFVEGSETVEESNERITVRYLSTHPYGCRVIQRVLEFCTDEQKRPILDQLLVHIRDLATDQYGNYVVQHIIEHGSPDDRDIVVRRIMGYVLTFSQHKFASNVIEKCLKNGTSEERNLLIDEACDSGPNEPNGTRLLAMMKDPYANYVVQKMLDVADSAHRRRMMLQIKPHIPSLRKFNYGKHIIMKLERYFQRHNGVAQDAMMANNERFPVHQAPPEMSRNGQIMNR